MEPQPQHMNVVELNDEELKTLNDVLRSTKVTFSSEDALMIKLGKATNPVLELTFKIATLFDARVAEVNAPK